MDELLGKRLADLERRLGVVEERMATSPQVEAVASRIDQVRTELIDHIRQVELRPATAVHGVLAAVQDLKTWHQERDDMRSRMQQLEARLAEVENRTSS